MEKEFRAGSEYDGVEDKAVSEGFVFFWNASTIEGGRKFIGNYESTATGERGSKREVVEGVFLEICIKILVVVRVALEGIFLKGLTWA